MISENWDYPYQIIDYRIQNTYRMSRVARSPSCHESSTDSAMLQRAACTSARINRCIPCRIQVVPERCPFSSRKVSCESWVAIDTMRWYLITFEGDHATIDIIACNVTLLFAFLFQFSGRCLILQSRLRYARVKGHDDRDSVHGSRKGSRISWRRCSFPGKRHVANRDMEKVVLEVTDVLYQGSRERIEWSVVWR